jgi:hypothetical protein
LRARSARNARLPTDKPIVGAVIKCSGNRNHVIKVGDLAPHASHRFKQTFDTEYGEAAYLDVLVGGQAVIVRYVDQEARTKSVLDIAYAVYAATELSLVEHEIDKDEITVNLRADTRFLDRDRAAQGGGSHGGLREVRGAT